MPIANPIQYSSRTFQSILNDINSDSQLIDKPSWWKRIWAGIGDVISIWLNSMVNLIFLRTSYVESAVRDLCELIDYSMSPHSTSTGKVLFYVKADVGAAIFPFTVSAVDLASRSAGNISVGSKYFESRANNTFTDITQSFTADAVNDWLVVVTDIVYTGHKAVFVTSGTLPDPMQLSTEYWLIRVSATHVRVADSLENALAGVYIDLTDAGTGAHALHLMSKAIDVYQQESLDAPVQLGSSDGITEWQEFDIPDKLMLRDTLSITINSILWTRVDSFADSVSSSKHFKLIPLSDNQFRIRFGNGTFGLIPPAFPVFASYSFGGGSDSNINTINNVNSYAGSEDKLVAASNPEIITGGSDRELISTAKAIAPILLKARAKFVETDDGEALAYASGGVAYLKLWPNYYGVFSCRVIGIAPGGGNPSGTTRTTISTTLKRKSILDRTDIYFDPADIVSIDVDAYIVLESGYAFATVEKFATLAFQLFLTETGKEITDIYQSSGIVAAVAFINNLFGSGLVEADYNAVSILLQNLKYRTFGETIAASDVLGYIDSFVAGVASITLGKFGVSNLPYYQSADQITTPGTINIFQA